jgi:hypothetical protein
MRALRHFVPFALLAALFVGCAADPGAGSTDLIDTGRTPDGGPDAAEDGSPEVGADVEIDYPSGVPHLEFVTDQAIDIPVQSTIDLQVRYVDGEGNPIPGVSLAYDYDEVRARDSALRTLSSQTGDDGVGTVTLVAGTQAVDFEILVSVRGDVEVAPLTFYVEVSPKDSTDYIVQLYYETGGGLAFSKVDVFLFDNEDGCDAVPRDGNIVGAFDQRFTRPRSDGAFDPIEVEVDRDFFPMSHVVALAYMEDQLVGIGCNDGPFRAPSGDMIDPADVEVGQNATVDVYINELFPDIRGEYAIETEFDLVEFLPPDVQNVVRYIGQFFDSPGATIFDILRDTEVFDSDDLPFGLGDAVADAVDSLLFAFLPPEALAVFESGTDIYEAIQNIRMRGRIAFFENADELGNLADCNEIVLDKLVINFDTITDGEFDLRSRGYSAAYGTFTGDLDVRTTDGVQYVVNIDPFSLDLNYGEIAVFILEEIVFPLVLGEDVRSLEDFVASFFDCAEIADAVGWSPIESLCDTAIGAAVTGIRDFLTAQSVDSASFYQLGTPPEGTTIPSDVELLEEGMYWGACGLRLNPRAFQVDALGGPGRNRCVWDARLLSGPSDPSGRQVPAAFFANTPRTLGAAVCGDGR